MCQTTVCVALVPIRHLNLPLKKPGEPEKPTETMKLCQHWRWFEPGSVAYLICDAGI